MSELGPVDRLRRSGEERFHQGGAALDFNLRSFWQWSASDLVSNTLRGLLAEYIVAQALGVANDGIREEWAPYDLRTPEGIAVEVKSAAYIQSWHQERLSTISFLCPKTRAWDPQTGFYEDEARRQARVYVFALLAHEEQATLNPLDLDQWEFYVVPTVVLDARKRSQHSITLPSLKALPLHGVPVGFEGIAEAVARAAGEEARD
ncbi:hypothetical protein [Synechococcus sp. CCAP 1479/9]|uniref:hypothetical protein n=1 Tax=Synechococcus sp. CCAP 1479/9 TaxID=1221593 RepID=UPI001C24059C|nr:hypothetical protein [Synechococcus sp. CCAP 1479/9]